MTQAADFFIKVMDDGFAPYMLPNDTAAIQRKTKIESGEFIAVAIDGAADAVLRRVYVGENGITLTVDNVDCKNDNSPITIGADELDRVRIYGKVVSIQRDAAQAAANNWYGYGEREGVING